MNVAFAMELHHAISYCPAFFSYCPVCFATLNYDILSGLFCGRVHHSKEKSNPFVRDCFIYRWN